MEFSRHTNLDIRDNIISHKSNRIRSIGNVLFPSSEIRFHLRQKIDLSNTKKDEKAVKTPTQSDVTMQRINPLEKLLQHTQRCLALISRTLLPLHVKSIIKE